MATPTMADSPSNSETIEAASTTKIPSAIPLAVKNGILDCTRTAVSMVKNAVGSCLIAGTLAVGGAPAVMAGEPQNPTAVLQANGFSGPSAEWVLALSNFVREKQSNGWLAPTEAVSITSVEALTPDGKGLDQLVNTGSKLPKKSFSEVTNESVLTTENYATVVEALFNPADIDVWLTKSDGTPMNAQEKADYRESLASAKARWLVKLPELASTGKQETIVRWFGFFNTLATHPIHGSREEFRRGIIAANSMANYSNIPLDKQKLYAPATVTQAAELVLMTDPRAQMVKIERSFNEPGKPIFTLKYLVASDKSLEEAGFAEGIQATQIALQGFNQDQAKKYDLQARSIAADNKIASLESKATSLESKADKMKRLNDLSFLILSDFDKFSKERNNPQFISSLNKNLQALKTLKTELEPLLKAESWVFSEKQQKEMKELLALLVQTARTYNVNI